MNVREMNRVGLGLLVIAVLGCKTEEGNGGSAGAPGLGVAGAIAGSGGVAGTNVAGAGAGGAGVGGAGAGGAGAGGAGAGAAGAAGMAAGAGGMGGAGMAAPMITMEECLTNAAAMGRTGACAECGCTKCLPVLSNCQDETCAGVVSCGQMHGCRGRDCYCGAELDALMCAVNGAEGPCMNEIAAASGVCMEGAYETCAQYLSQVTSPDNMAYDPTNPVSRANAVSICTRGQAEDPGVPGLVAPAEYIMGMCEAECAE